MDDYTDTAYKAAALTTHNYSTSFGKASKLFPTTMRPHIYAIYGLVRIADEIVDTYTGPGADKLLNELEQEAYAALARGYSSNILVHAFAHTARIYDITQGLIEPFFASMRTDLNPPKHFTQQAYSEYIYGSAEVVGLMCLKVFCGSDTALYAHLRPGALRLGAAYQKINFLRDLAADYQNLGRYYFPIDSFDTFTDKTKLAIIRDIRADFTQALPAMRQLPKNAQAAVYMSYRYFNTLLIKLQNTPAETIKTTRIRIPDSQKLGIAVSAKLAHKTGRLA